MKDVVIIDDKIDVLHYYTSYIKFSIWMTTYDSSQKIRNHHLTIEHGCSFVKKFDGKFPDKYYKEIMDYIDLDPSKLNDLCEKSLWYPIVIPIPDINQKSINNKGVW